MHVLNANFGELLPVITIGTGNTPITSFTDIGAQFPDCVITNLGQWPVILTTNATAVVPGATPVQNSCLIGPGVVATFRKGFGVKVLNGIAVGGSSSVWINAMNGS